MSIPVITEGWLEKRGPTIEYGWHKRWCVLTRDTFLYFTDESKEEEKGDINIKSCTRLRGFTEDKAPGDAVKHYRERPAGFVLDVDPAAGKERRLYYFDAGELESQQTWAKGFEQLQSGARKKGPTNPKAFKGCVQQVMPACVVMFSGCKDNQTSADVGDCNSFGLPADAGPGGAGGACTNSMISALSSQKEVSWIGLLDKMRTILAGEYTQIPQLSSSRPLNLKARFSTVHPKSSGSLKALLVGINYCGSSAELRGCHNDVETMRRYLVTQGYDPSNMKILCDDGENENPDKDGIMAGCQWLVAGASLGDSLFFHYSGHGSHQIDLSGDEKDGQDECLCPSDYETSGMISDDDLFLNLVAPLPPGILLTCVMDCCHSGTILDLPYCFKANGQAVQAVNTGNFSGMQPNNNFNVGSTVALIGANHMMCSNESVAGAQALGPAMNSQGDFDWDLAPEFDVELPGEALDIIDYDSFLGDIGEGLDGVQDFAEEAAENVGDFAEDTVEAIQESDAVEKAGEFAEEAAENVGDFAEDAVEAIQESDAVEKAGEFAEEAAENIGDFAEDAVEAIQESDAVEKAGEFAEEAAENIGDFAEDAVEGIQESDAVDKAGEFAEETAENIGDFAEDAVEGIQESDAVDKAGDFAEEAAENIGEFAGDAIEGIQESDAFDKVGDFAEDAMDNIPVGDALENVGEFAEDAFENVGDVFENVEMGDAVDDMGGFMEGAMENVGDFMEGAVDEIPVSDVMDDVGDFMEGAMDGAGDAIGDAFESMFD